MFSRILNFIKDRTPETSTIPQWDIKDKPFCSSLIHRHIAETEQAKAYVNEQVDNVQPLTFPKELSEVVKDAISGQAFKLSINAFQNLGGTIPLPGDTFTKEQIGAVVFAYLLGMSLWGHAYGEGVVADLKKAFASITYHFTILHTEGERSTLVEAAFPIYEGIRSAKGDGIEKWHESVHHLMYLHAQQWDSDDDKLKKLNTVELCQPFLKHLLGSFN